MKILIYSTTWCAPCQELTKWLDAEGLAYEKKLTDKDPEAMNEFMQVNDGFLGVPFTVITDDDGKQTKIKGYDQALFRSVLGL